MVKKYPNPKLRVSFITYSTEGRALVKLTSDKNKIRDGLAELQNIVPTGATHMQEGFIKVNEQIEEVNSGGPSTSNLIITVTTAPIPSTSLPMINFEVNKAVRMKSTLYFVAYKDYKKEELRNIVQTPSQVYEAERFLSLNRMLNSLVGNSCTKVTSETTYFVCLKEDYSVRYRIPSSYQSRKDEILCRYKLKDNSVYGRSRVITAWTMARPMKAISRSLRFSVMIRYKM
ncbi:Anthrax toxin receptor-like [Vulpes lagopus]